MKGVQLLVVLAMMLVTCHSLANEQDTASTYSGITQEQRELVDCAASLKRMRVDAEERSLNIYYDYFGALVAQLALRHNLSVDIDDIHAAKDAAHISSCPSSISSIEQILIDALNGVSFEEQTQKLDECSVSLFVSEGLLNARQVEASDLIEEIKNLSESIGGLYVDLSYLYNGRDALAIETAQIALEENLLRARRMFETGVQSHMTELKSGFESCEYHGLDVSFLVDQ